MGNNLRGEAIPDDGVQIAHYDENTMINQGTSDWPLPQLTFHQVHGTNIQLLRGGRIAKRKESFCKGLAFSSRPIQVDENVCIRFSEVVSNWSGVLRFGVTNVDPETFRDTELPKFACPDLTSKEGYWAKALPERYSVEGSILHFYVNSEGELYYGINGVLKGQFLNGINVYSPLWVIVDIYGNSSALEFIDPNDVRIRSARSAGTGRSRQSRPVLAQSPAASSGVETSQSRPVRSTASVSPNLPSSKYHAGVNFSPLTFHSVHGKHITLSHNYNVAERHAGEFACGYVFTSRPITFNEKVVIQVLDVEPAYSGSMAFGLTCCDPITLQASALPVDSDDLLERPEYWVSIKDVGAQPKVTDELAFWIGEKGQVYFAKNNLAPRVIIYVDTAVNLWAFFDVYGTTQKIRILGTVKVGAVAPASHRVPPLPTSSRSARSLLDLSPDPRPPAARGSNNEQTAMTVSNVVRNNLHEDLPPVVTRRTSSEIPGGSDAHIVRMPITTPTDRARPFNPPLSVGTAPRPAMSSANWLLDVVESMHNQAHRLPEPVRPTRAVSPAAASLRPQNPPPVPARAPPAAPARPTVFPPPRPPPLQTGGNAKKAEDEMEDGDECRVCMSAKVNSVIYTCGHMSLCYECAMETWRTRGECPICRNNINDVIKIYKS